MDTSASKNQLNDVVRNFDVAMLITYTDNAVHARPMALTHQDDGSDVYLVTHIHALKVDEIRANPQALLTFQGTSQFASLSGTLAVLADTALLEKLWKEAWKIWFPQGKSDPNIALLQFTPSQGEYWDNAGMQGLKYAFEAAKAYVAGTTPTANDAQHAKVRW